MGEPLPMQGDAHPGLGATGPTQYRLPMAQNKTVATSADVTAFIEGLSPDDKRADAQTLDALFRKATGYDPVMWGASMIGYGRYHYVYKSGREGDYLATGFSPRAKEFSIYIMPGYADFGDILSRLGKHRTGKSCLYVKRLSDIDPPTLIELIQAGLRDLSGHWDVYPA